MQKDTGAGTGETPLRKDINAIADAEAKKHKGAQSDIFLDKKGTCDRCGADLMYGIKIDGHSTIMVTNHICPLQSNIPGSELMGQPGEQPISITNGTSSTPPAETGNDIPPGGDRLDPDPPQP